MRARDKLTPNAASDRWQAYYASEGGLALLCVLPDGTTSGGNCSGGTGHETSFDIATTALNRLASVTNAISDDGSRVYWTDSAAQETGAGKVYLRLNPGAEQSAAGCEAGKACTVKVSETKSTRDSRFLMASPDGSKALFEVTEGPLEGDLYRFDAGTGTSELVAGEVVGLAGASEGLSRVYFVSEEALGGEAVAGEPNLYLGEAGEEAFIATLSEADVAASEIPSNTSPQPVFHAARASVDGSALAFISNASLTGYDNADLESGEPASEAYVYEIGAEGPACVSCSPSGARPRARLVQGTGNSQESLMTAGSLPMADNMLHTPRALSASGERLFFNSFDALLPRDTNGKEDVYEWESAGGKAACEALGAELYAPSAAGCLSLVSSGESPEDSEFLDASPSGNDAFFLTNSSLLAQDPGLFDVYDARVGGGLPPPPPPPPDCQGETCKPPATAPNDPTPASSTYVGPGDVKEKAKKKAKKKKKKKAGKKGKGKKQKKKESRKGRAGR